MYNCYILQKFMTIYFQKKWWNLDVHKNKHSTVTGKMSFEVSNGLLSFNSKWGYCQYLESCHNSPIYPGWLFLSSLYSQGRLEDLVWYWHFRSLSMYITCFCLFREEHSDCRILSARVVRYEVPVQDLAASTLCRCAKIICPPSHR